MVLLPITMGFLNWLSGNKLNTNTESLEISGTNISVYQANKQMQLIEEIKIGIEILIAIIIVVVALVALKKYRKKTRRTDETNKGRSLDF